MCFYVTDTFICHLVSISYDACVCYQEYYKLSGVSIPNLYVWQFILYCYEQKTQLKKYEEKRKRNSSEAIYGGKIMQEFISNLTI